MSVPLQPVTFVLQMLKMFSKHMLTITSSGWIVPFINMYRHSLYFLNNLGLKSTSFGMSIDIPACIHILFS
jgi:hypothetical protein